MRIPIEPTGEDVPYEHDRTKLLKVPDGIVLPDPLVLTEEWLKRFPFVRVGLAKRGVDASSTCINRFTILPSESQLHSYNENSRYST